jgi:hypothetical protein
VWNLENLDEIEVQITSVAGTGNQRYLQISEAWL